MNQICGRGYVSVVCVRASTHTTYPVRPKTLARITIKYRLTITSTRLSTLDGMGTRTGYATDKSTVSWCCTECRSEVHPHTYETLTLYGEQRHGLGHCFESGSPFVELVQLVTGVGTRGIV